MRDNAWPSKKPFHCQSGAVQASVRRTREAQEADNSRTRGRQGEEKSTTIEGQERRTTARTGFVIAARGQGQDKWRSPARLFRGAAKTRRTRPGHTEPTEDNGHRAQPHRAQPQRGQEKDKAWTQSRAPTTTKAQPQSRATEDKRRTRPGATEFRGAVSECGQLFVSKIEPQQKTACKKTLNELM